MGYVDDLNARFAAKLADSYGRLSEEGERDRQEKKRAPMGCGICTGYAWDLCPIHGAASLITAESIDVCARALISFISDRDVVTLESALADIVAAQDKRDTKAELSIDDLNVDYSARVLAVTILRGAHAWEHDVENAEPGIIARHDYTPLSIGGDVRRMMMVWSQSGRAVSYFFGVELERGSGVLRFWTHDRRGNNVVRHICRTFPGKSPGGLWMVRATGELSAPFDRFAE